MKKLTAQRRGLLGGAAALFAVLAVVAGVMSPAHADVDPNGADARFLHLYDKGNIMFHYRAEGYMLDDSGKRKPDSTWKVWEGDLDGGPAVLGWTPANERARIDIQITSTKDGHSLLTKDVPGNKNYCLKSNGDGTWTEHESSVGGGGDGECTTQ
jgi:hypothetical protein